MLYLVVHKYTVTRGTTDCGLHMHGVEQLRKCEMCKPLNTHTGVGSVVRASVVAVQPPSEYMACPCDAGSRFHGRCSVYLYDDIIGDRTRGLVLLKVSAIQRV